MERSIYDKGYYCPDCGYFLKKSDKYCSACGNKIKPVVTKKDFDYYLEAARQEYNDKSKWYDLLLEKEMIPSGYIKTEYEEDCRAHRLVMKQVKDMSDELIKIQNDIIEERNRKTWERLEQEEKIKKATSSKQKSEYTPKCPICGSPNINKISYSKKLVGAAAFGIFSQSVRKQWECKDCKTKF